MVTMFPKFGDKVKSGSIYQSILSDPVLILSADIPTHPSWIQLIKASKLDCTNKSLLIDNHPDTCISNNWQQATRTAILDIFEHIATEASSITYSS